MLIVSLFFLVCGRTYREFSKPLGSQPFTNNRWPRLLCVLVYVYQRCIARKNQDGPIAQLRWATVLLGAILLSFLVNQHSSMKKSLQMLSTPFLLFFSFGNPWRSIWDEKSINCEGSQQKYESWQIFVPLDLKSHNLVQDATKNSGKRLFKNLRGWKMGFLEKLEIGYFDKKVWFWGCS